MLAEQLRSCECWLGSFEAHANATILKVKDWNLNLPFFFFFMKIRDRQEALDFVVETHRCSIILHRGGGKRELTTWKREENENL